MNGPTELAAEFMRANDESPVVEGWVHYPDPCQNKGGGGYRLDDGRVFNLNVEDCRSLPEQYPRWRLLPAIKMS